MGGTHFYLTLPNNSSLGDFPDNKTTSYRVKLPQTIDLERNWEGGLYSVSYPNTWYTLQDGSDTHIFYADKSGVFKQAIIDYGYYHSMQDLVKVVNKALAKNVNDNIKLTYNAVNRKATAQLTGTNSAYLVECPLSLRYGDNDLKIVTKTTVSPYVTDLTVVSTSYVYCNIVEPQVVGDTNVQLLKSIPAEGKFGEVIAKVSTYLSKPNHSRTWRFF